MIRCTNCGKENEDHYKFCLACGTELESAPVSKKEPRSKKDSAAWGKPSVSFPQPTPLQGPYHVTASHSDISIPSPTARTEPVQKAGAEQATADHAISDHDRAALLETMPASADLLPELLRQKAAAEAKTRETEQPLDFFEKETREVILSGSEQEDEFDGGSLGTSLEEDTQSGQPKPSAAPLRKEEEQEDELESTFLGVKPSVTTKGGTKKCTKCSDPIPPGFLFCGSCGARVSADEPAKIPGPTAEMEQPKEVVQRGRLVIIQPDGTFGESVPLFDGENNIGRESPMVVFSEDLFLSPAHASMCWEEDNLYINDEGSVNGTFIKIAGQVEIFHNDHFRIGQELIKFQALDKIDASVKRQNDDPQDLLILGSPVSDSAWGRLCQIVAPNTMSNAYLLDTNEIILGREHGNIIFPEDGFVSGTHAKILNKSGRYFLMDLGSSNGTYYNVRTKTLLKEGDLVLLGQQLFKIELQ